MIVLYEWRDLIENADYLIALQALAILQVSRKPNMHEKIYIWNVCSIALKLSSLRRSPSLLSLTKPKNIFLVDIRDIWNPKKHPTEI